MSTGAFSLEQLKRIMDVLGLSLRDLLHLMEELPMRPLEESVGKHFAGNPEDLLVFYRLNQGWSRQKIQECYDLPTRRLREILQRLEKLGLIAGSQSRQVRVLFRNPITWGPGSHFNQVYHLDLAERIFRKGKAESTRLGAFRPFQLVLTREEHRELKQRLQELIDSYARKTPANSLKSPEELVPTGGMLVCVEGDQFEELLLSKIRAKATKTGSA